MSGSVIHRFLHANHNRNRDRRNLCLVPVKMNIYGIFARRHTPAIGELVIQLSNICRVAQVVAQQIKDGAAFVRVTDRHIARCLNPQIHISIQLVRPTQLNDDVPRATDRVMRGSAWIQMG